MDSNLNSESLQNWVKTLRLKKEAEFLAKLQNEGVECLEHLVDIDHDDLGKDYHDWHLTTTEKNRFKRELCTLAEQKGGSITKKVQCQHEAARRETKRKRMSSYRSNMSEEQKERIKQKDRERKRQKKNQNGPNGDGDGDRNRDGDGVRDRDRESEAQRDADRDGDGVRDRDRESDADRDADRDADSPTSTNDESQPAPASLIVPYGPANRSENLLSERMIDQKLQKWKNEILAEFSQEMQKIKHKLEEAEADRKRLQEENEKIKAMTGTRNDREISEPGNEDSHKTSTTQVSSGASTVLLSHMKKTVPQIQSVMQNITLCEDPKSTDQNISCGENIKTHDQDPLYIMQCQQDCGVSCNTDSSDDFNQPVSTQAETTYDCSQVVDELDEPIGVNEVVESIASDLKAAIYQNPPANIWFNDPVKAQGSVTCGRDVEVEVIMPRKAVISYDREQLDAAIQDFSEGGKSRRMVGRMYGIPESTLRDHTGTGKYSGYDTTNGPALSLLSTEEEALVSYIIYMADRGFPLTRSHIKSFAVDILREAGRPSLINLEKGPSDKWVRNFLKRHPILSERKPDVLDRDRAEVNYSAVTGFVDLLSQTLDDTGLAGKPERIFNTDETGFSGKQSVRGRVIAKKGVRHPHQRMVTFPGHTTVLVTASAAGNVLPPLIIFDKAAPSSDIQVPGDWMVTSSETGYITKDLFLLWLKQGFHVHCGRERPVLLIMDNHVSHVSPGVIEFARESGIELLCLPSHSTHILQPLDVGYFAQLKSEVVALVALGYAGMRSVPKVKFPKLLHHAMSGMSQSCVTGAFQHTGIFPLNPGKIGPDTCMSAETVPDKQNEADLCHECGNPKENPLVRMGIVPAKLASILLPPPQPSPRRRRKDWMTEARLLTAKELSSVPGLISDGASEPPGKNHQITGEENIQICA